MLPTGTRPLLKDGDRDQDRVIQEVGEDHSGEQTALLKRRGEEIPRRDGEDESQAVIDVIAGSQKKAQDQGAARIPAELVEANEKVAVDDDFLRHCGGGRYRQAINHVIGGDVTNRGLIEEPGVVFEQSAQWNQENELGPDSRRDEPDRRPDVGAPAGEREPEHTTVLPRSPQEHEHERRDGRDREVFGDPDEEAGQRMAGYDEGHGVGARAHVIGVANDQHDRGHDPRYEKREHDEARFPHELVSTQAADRPGADRARARRHHRWLDDRRCRHRDRLPELPAGRGLRPLRWGSPVGRRQPARGWLGPTWRAPPRPYPLRHRLRLTPSVGTPGDIPMSGPEKGTGQGAPGLLRYG